LGFFAIYVEEERFWGEMVYLDSPLYPIGAFFCVGEWLKNAPIAHCTYQKKKTMGESHSPQKNAPMRYSGRAIHQWAFTNMGINNPQSEALWKRIPLYLMWYIWRERK
jgi:hypothetical protein